VVGAGFVSLSQAIPRFPWPDGQEYVERMIDLHIDAQMPDR
jgi:hypothetical protein